MKVKAETGPCTMRSALNVASPARFPSNRLKEGLSIAGTATMSLNLSYVRDAVPQYETVDNSIRSINMDLLPVLANIEEAFRAGS